MSNEVDQTFQKPNLRNKGSRKGIKTGNTIKYDYNSNREINKTSTFSLQNIEPATRLSKSQQQRYYGNSEKKDMMTVGQSLNKNKAWEKIEEIKKDPNYIVDEQLGLNRKNVEIQHKYTIKEDKTENQKDQIKDEEGEWEIVKGRKGKTIKPQRTPGKKGVKKNVKVEGKIETEATYVVYVEKSNPKHSGPVFQKLYAKHHDTYGDYKNYKTKQRREAGENCQL
jgi:hypothetical protein